MKREIDLSEDKVETIKNVMKGFKLPEASIPVWAKGLTDDSWNSKLSDTIVKKIDPTSVNPKKS